MAYFEKVEELLKSEAHLKEVTQIVKEDHIIVGIRRTLDRITPHSMKHFLEEPWNGKLKAQGKVEWVEYDDFGIWIVQVHKIHIIRQRLHPLHMHFDREGCRALGLPPF